VVASLNGVRSPVRERVFDYWKKIDAKVGAQIEQKAGSGEKVPEPAK
jgi:catalase